MVVHLLRVYIIGADNAIDTLAFNILQDLESLERVKLRILSAEYYSQQLVLAVVVVVVVVVVVFTEEYMFCLEANSELCSNRSSCSKTTIYSCLVSKLYDNGAQTGPRILHAAQSISVFEFRGLATESSSLCLVQPDVLGII